MANKTALHNTVVKPVSRVVPALLASVSVALILGACAMGSDYKKPTTDMPQQWPWQRSLESDTAGGKKYDVISAQWWQEFQDPAMSALIEEGLNANADLAVAAARVAQARAMLTTREADLYPSISLQGDASRAQNSEESIMGRLASKPFSTFELGAVLNYELDVWGRLRRQNESARAQLMATRANRDAVHLAVASNIAIGYINLRALDAQIDITNNTIASRMDALDFQKKQYQMGGENALTFHQAEAELAAAQAQKPLLQQAGQEQESALAVLLGRTPKEIVDGLVQTGKSIDDLPAMPRLPVNMPSTLLERRPDIHAAEQALIAANADIGAAQADYFPRLSLSGILGLSAVDADRVFRSSAKRWQGGVSATMPLLDFGRRGAQVDFAKASKDEALTNYEQTVRVAFKEVIDALSAEQTSTKREEAQLKQMKSRAETVRLSDLRYKSGYSNYLELLDAQRFLHQAQMERVAAKRDRLFAAVNLYRALGGGWNNGEQQQNPAAPVVVAETAAPERVSMTTEKSQDTIKHVSVHEHPTRLISRDPLMDDAVPPEPAPADIKEKAAEPVKKSVANKTTPQAANISIAPSPLQQPMQLPAEMAQ